MLYIDLDRLDPDPEPLDAWLYLYPTMIFMLSGVGLGFRL